MAVDQAVSGLGAQLVHDREAVGEIYVALGSTVRSYLQNLVGHDDADDIVQRVFYEVWRHNRRYDPSRSLTAWVLGIARKRGIDHLHALSRLPDEQREVLVLAYFGRFTQSEIATHLEIPLGTVKARAFRGLRRLAELLS
jgi:DNA-directed RNA polymerase specialized sigma24 family protein